MISRVNGSEHFRLAAPSQKFIRIPEDYLHTLTYSLDVLTPPAGQDGVDHFLFDSKTGYCDYFASAMALLLRNTGIPARVVSGYATGEQQSDGTYLVRDANAHSWTEVYFPRYGWIPFDPSAGWPRFARTSNGSTTVVATPVPTAPATVVQPTVTPVPTLAPPAPTEAAAPVPALRSESGTDDGSVRLVLVAIGVVGLVGLGARLAWGRWNRELERLPPVARVYLKMTRLGRLLGYRARPTDTPSEFGRRLARAIPDEASSVQWIAGEYARYRFGRPKPTTGDETGARWQRVRSALLRQLGPARWKRQNPTLARGIDAKRSSRVRQSA